MIGSLIAFELRRRVKQLSTYVYAVVMFAAGALMMVASGGVFAEFSVVTANERVMANSPHTIFSLVSTIALLCVFTVAAVFGQAAFQDFGHGTWPIVFTKNVRKAPYLLGRFLGAFIFSAILFLAIGAGALSGSVVVHVVKPDQLGPTSLLAYVWPYLLQVWPMLFLTGAAFFSLAALTRKMGPVYVGVVVVVLGYLLGANLLEDVDRQTLAALLDPFGLHAFDVVCRYWTPAERNRDLVPVLGILGANRLLWTVVGLGLLGLTVRFFRTTVAEERGRASTDAERSQDSAAYPVAGPQPTTGGWLRSTASLGWMYFGELIRSPVYWAFALCGLAFGVVVMAVSDQIFGTPTLPVTYQVLDLARGSFSLFMLITLTFYAGELVWRDRDVGVADIVDATRMPTWVGFLSRFIALLLVVLSFEALTGVVALVAQVSRGYFDIDLPLYAMELLVIDFPRAAVLAVLAMTVQVLINNKYLGHFVMVGSYVLQPVLSWLGVEERLVRYGAEPAVTYSDMNGYGHFLWPLLWYRVYWVGFATLLVVGAYLVFVRGRDTALRARRRQAGPRFTTGWKAAAVGGALAWLGTGAFCIYNTHILNEYITKKDAERQRADYEKTYKRFATMPHPRITDAEAQIDIFASQRRLFAKGRYQLENKTDQPIRRLLVALDEELVVKHLSVLGVEAPSSESEPKRGLYVFDLPQDMTPGQRGELTYEVGPGPEGAHGPAH